MKRLEVVILFTLFAVGSLRANTIFYNVDFNHDQLNQPPAVGAGTNSPTAGPETGSPVVVKSFDQLRDRPLLISGESYNALEFPLKRGAPDYTIDFDFETHNFTTNGLFVISPILTLTGNGQVSGNDERNYPFTWTDDQAHHLHIVFGVANPASNQWSAQLDNSEPIIGGYPGSFDPRELDFSVLDADSNSRVAIDNVVIGTSTNYMPVNVFFPMSKYVGSGPQEKLTRDAEGNFYGTSVAGQSTLFPGNYGTVFKIDKHGQLVWVFHFNNSNGANPHGGVTIGSDGFLYGSTAFGGIGTVFKMSEDGKLIWSVYFEGTNGSYPSAGVVTVPNQKGEVELYGTTTGGGANGNGTIFKLDASQNIHVLHSFLNGEAGAWPHRLLLGDDGLLYGTTQFENTNGTIFRISRSGADFTNIFVFNGTNGSAPGAGLTKYGKNTFYGTTEGGGTNFEGTIYRITTSGEFTLMHTFGLATNFLGPSVTGNAPESELVLGRDGNFYGTTFWGGFVDFGNYYGYGTVFRMSPAGDFQKLADFHGGDGSAPAGAMIEVERGKFYGLATEMIGAFSFNEGAIFNVSAMQPTIVIDKPSQSTGGNATQFQITGKTKCDPPVTNVFYSINGGDWIQATTTNGWLNWAGVATVQKGKNTIQACAVSAFGDISKTNTMKFK